MISSFWHSSEAVYSSASEENIEVGAFSFQWIV
jgi:hypothetical protein